MRQYYFRMIRLIWGLFLFSFGIVVTMKAHIGYAPWDVFHVGLAKTIGVSIGTVAIITGIIIGIISLLLGEKIGLGTILNMILIGVFFDLIYELPLIPLANNLALGITMLMIGLFIIALASYFYIGSGLGAGPRDSLMVAITRKTGLPIGVCRGVIELFAVLVGWALGGMVGIGTVLAAFAIGFCVQITFNLLKFDVTKVQHETLDYTYKTIFRNKKQKVFEEKEALQNE